MATYQVLLFLAFGPLWILWSLGSVFLIRGARHAAELLPFRDLAPGELSRAFLEGGSAFVWYALRVAGGREFLLLLFALLAGSWWRIDPLTSPAATSAADPGDVGPDAAPTPCHGPPGLFAPLC